MGRYTFTEADLARLKPLLSTPVVRRALAAAIPVKQFAAPARHVERLPLPVAVRNRDNPDGVDLNEILAAVRAQAPAARSVTVRGDSVVIVSDRPPRPAERRKLAALLADRDQLTNLRPRLASADDADLTRVLLDDATDDQQWLQAFRRYATTHLIDRDGGPK
jgi:hypothetical protein